MSAITESTPKTFDKRSAEYLPYCPTTTPVGTLANCKLGGDSLLVFHNGHWFVSFDFVGKYQKRKVRKSAELSVFSTGAPHEKLCAISASLNLRNLEITNIQGKRFVKVDLLRRTRIDRLHEITQGYMKIKCPVQDCMDRGEIEFCRRNDKVVVAQVSGWLRESGVRENMILAECLDFAGPKKKGIHLHNARNNVNYRLTFKFDFVEEMQLYQDSQVLVKIQCNSSKGVLIQFWDWYLQSLDMHLHCLVKSTPSSFVFGVVISSVKVLGDDVTMKKVIEAIAMHKCRISHYIKGGKMKADAANKLTLLIQSPPLQDLTHQKYTASLVMKKIHDLLAPITNDHDLRCATAEIAEVVTLTKMVSLIWTASMICGRTLEEFEIACNDQVGDDKQRSINDFLWKVSNRLRDAPILFCPRGESLEDICHPDERTRALAKQSLSNYTQQCAHEVHKLIKDTYMCDLVNKPEESEVDRRELINGIDFLGNFIEKMIAEGDLKTVQYLRLVLLDGRCKADLENDSGIYNPGHPKTWLQCFKWKFNKSEKETNLTNLKKTLTQSWRRSKKTDSTKPISITAVRTTSPAHVRIAKTRKLVRGAHIAAPAARLPKTRTLRGVVQFALEAKLKEAQATLEQNLSLKQRGLKTIEKYAAAGTQLPLLSSWSPEPASSDSEL